MNSATKIRKAYDEVASVVKDVDLPISDAKEDLLPVRRPLEQTITGWLKLQHCNWRQNAVACKADNNVLLQQIVTYVYWEISKFKHKNGKEAEHTSSIEQTSVCLDL